MADVSEQEEKNKGGRPPKFETVEELEAAISAYFDMQDPHTEDRLVESGVSDKGETIFMRRKVMTEQKPYTVSGLARALGMSRETLVQYKKNEKFSDSILPAYERCHEFAETQLYSRNASGASFSLKNNWGWKDRQEVDHTTKDQPIPLLAGIAPAALVVEDEDDGGTASADDSANEDQQS
ncbi:terminase small subunit [Rhodococcus qingshengii]|uniref:terminase small subunit n=1 Tax=Rhodococcus qingshengii TaxID=334542 RepID=UPI0029425BFC|nr:terminase small subunit [Rhodococcus qingshengii]WOI85983.1 terminase small subunit [Rhodococcus qingshengii]